MKSILKLTYFAWVFTVRYGIVGVKIMREGTESMVKRVIVSFAILVGIILVLMIGGWHVAAQTFDEFVYLPLVVKPEPPPESMVEFRGLWVTRFDWTTWSNTGNGARPAKIDEIVQNAADAGFNVLFFQIRGEADAYYASDLEPWAKRISFQELGQPPGSEWDGLGDPLSYMIQKAHDAGLQVHAYLNVYPVTSCSAIPDADVTPTPLYHQLIAEHGTTTVDEEEKVNGLQWLTDGQVYCSGDQYLWASPASGFHEDHVMAVVQDIAARYEIDGLHLDRIRYANSYASCDPVSLAETGECFGAPPSGYASYEDWQRAQVGEFVGRIYDEVLAVHPDLWLSAAVWPVHTKKEAWGWEEPYQEGYSYYYQDSKGWLTQGKLDSISPMIYPGSTSECPDSNEYWTQERWGTLVADYEAESNGRYIIPGIGGHYCSFAEIEARIQLARDIGTAGHAIFSYRLLLENEYFDDLAMGPYGDTAVVPEIPWRP
jgi:uncharacterized lipoprotein YddW (UPF0748 family)